VRLALVAFALLALFAQDVACPKCKAKLKPDARFCGECGEKAPRKECAGCKEVLKPGARFCAGCGRKADETPAAAPAPGQDAKPDAVKEKRGDELEKFGVTAEQVNRAIERGAAFLASHYAKRKEMSSDEDYLASYALIHTSPYHANAKLREKIEALLRGDAWLRSNHRVYAAGIRALALEATKDPDLKALARECAEYLIESQGPKGTWSYRADVKLTPREAKAPERPSVSVSGGEPLDHDVPGEVVARKGGAGGGDGDNSCTQFAVLGLHAAAKCGFKAPPEVWKKCLEETEKRFTRDGGWGYHGAGEHAYGSMTCAGICTLALCGFYAGDAKYLENEKLRAGLKWMAENFSVTENPKAKRWPMYSLYSIERVGVFAATESIGEHRWYPLGAKHLVQTQKDDGSWQPAGEDREVATSLALLFLTRATAPVRAAKRGGKGWLETHALNESQNFMFILDASGSMREELDGKEKFEIAKEVIESIVKRLPEGAHAGLRVYGHRYTGLQKEADTDSELVIPVGPLRPGDFVARVKALRCRGKTPITHSLNETVKDIAGVDRDLELVTILLTDGGESTRNAKPAEAAARLAAARPGMKLHVVGFDINEDDWKEQLQAAAAAGGGRYFHALKASDLLNALAFATVGGSDYAVVDKDGKEVVRGKLGDRHELPEGKYAFRIEVEGKKEEKTVWINTEVVSRVSVDLGRLLKK
jgi:hypothetical protein